VLVILLLILPKKPLKLNSVMKIKYCSSFSLLESVFAIALLTFILTALLGLITLNLKSNEDSSSEKDAANMATLLISARRVIPLDRHALCLPALSTLSPGQELSETFNIDSEGQKIPNEKKFRLTYNILRDEKLTNLYRLHLKLKWPATPLESKRDKNEFEIKTSIRLDEWTDSST